MGQDEHPQEHPAAARLRARFAMAKQLLQQRGDAGEDEEEEEEEEA